MLREQEATRIGDKAVGVGPNGNTGDDPAKRAESNMIQDYATIDIQTVLNW